MLNNKTKKREFFTVKAVCLSDLDKLLTEYMNNGWQLHGHIFELNLPHYHKDATYWFAHAIKRDGPVNY